jgi:probable F420-dependent oxidoreductase
MRISVTAFVTDRCMGIGDLASAVEERGFDGLYVPEHTHLPLTADVPPGLVDGVRLDDYRRSLDPFVSLAAAAARTSRIRLGTGVCLVAQHDPIVLAKQVATLDQLSGGRVVLGVGFGWNAAELADHGVAFADRRDVTREKVECMQALWTMAEPEYHGRFVDLPPCHSWPKPATVGGPPVLLGGGAGPKLFDAIARYGHGWMPIGGGGVAAALPALRQAMSRAGRDPDALEIVPFGTVPTPAKLAHLHDLGATEVVLRVPAGPPSDMLPVLDDYRDYVDTYR